MPTIAAAAIGTLIQKTKRQPQPSTKAPPMIGPSASYRPNIEPNTPMTLARSTGSGNVLAVIAKLAEVQENLRLIDHKIDVYRGRLAAGDTDRLWAPGDRRVPAERSS
nr:hypothetical protein [Actinomadura formosensis]